MKTIILRLLHALLSPFGGAGGGFLSLFLFLIMSCSICMAQDTFRLERQSDSLHVLRLGGDAWQLPFPVYRFETADVNGDGSTDAIVGVVKATRYDPEVRRRVFVFKNYRGHVRPLWLGSRLGQPVVDFRFSATRGMLLVMETERSGRFLVAAYRWRSFGMEFVEYLGRELTEEQARERMGEAPSGSPEGGEKGVK